MGEISYGLAEAAVGQVVADVAAVAQDIRDAVYGAVTVVDLERVRELRESGADCRQIGEAMRIVLGASWPKSWTRWVGYWFCDASSRIHRERLDEAPWNLNGVPD